MDIYPTARKPQAVSFNWFRTHFLKGNFKAKTVESSILTLLRGKKSPAGLAAPQ